MSKQVSATGKFHWNNRNRLGKKRKNVIFKNCYYNINKNKLLKITNNINKSEKFTRQYKK